LQNQPFIEGKIGTLKWAEMANRFPQKIFHQISKICQKQRGIPLFLR
jgi:hypothetical protein